MTSFADPLAQTPWQLPDYAFVETLYQGAKTTVYRAIETATQTPVVIKVSSQEYPSTSELVQFRNQYTIAKNLPIPGIIRPLSLEPWGNGYGLVMEDMGGIALEQYVKQHSLSCTDVLSIAIQLTDILCELHQHRVVHKDIKPANVLIHPDSKQIKLIDFSIASLLPKEIQAIQNPRNLEGTLAYLAPEQTGRMNRGIDYRTDFYGLGVTLYQLFTGQLPFTSEDPLELIHGHMAQLPVAINQVNPDIPVQIAAIVAKLMAKNAEDRYQSALGLSCDLKQCLTQWKKRGEIAEFTLGQRDLSNRFLIPETLYGREAEVKILLDAFERVSLGTSELMLVAGFSGIGKTAVVNEVHKPIARQRGYFIKGKFDQFNRSVPFSAFVQAFRDLMGQLLSTSDTELHIWKTKILEALGDSAQVIIELIPELETILGGQPPVSELSGVAAQNRFNLLFQKFIQVFTTPEHPLVIFIDDLQWADSGSLNLIQVLMAESQTGYLFLLGAYRDNEVFPAHPFMFTINELKQAGAPVHSINLQPLSFTSLKHLIADTLHSQADVVQPLAELVMQKTQGNPFFATQFLRVLHQDGLITFDPKAGYWQCDIAQVREAAITDDVVALMASQLKKLPEATQTILKLAACIGAQFDLATLAIVSEQPHIEVATALWKVLQAGFILPTSEIYKFFQGESTEYQNTVMNPGYRFVHDRIQQATYSLIAKEDIALTHWHVGICLWQGWSAQQDDKIFDLVNQLNLGKSVIDQPDQIKQLTQLNLQAAQKAKLSAAYKSTQTYCETGIALLPESAWETDYDLMYALHYHGSEAAYLSGNFDRAETLYKAALNDARTPLEKAMIYRVQMTQYQLQGRNSEVIGIQRESNQLLGWSMPISADEIQGSLDAEIATVNQFLKQQTIDSISELPKMTDANIQEMLRILQILFYAAWLDGQPILALLALAKMTTLSLQYGNSEMSPFGYVGYGLVANILNKDVDQSYQFGYMAVQLCNQFDNADVRGMTNFLFAADVHSWKRPLREADHYYENAYKYSMEAGNWLTVSFMMMLSGSDRLTYGKNLEEFYPIIKAHVTFLEQIKSLENLDALTVGVLQPVRQLLGLTTSSSSFDDEHFSEANYLEKYQDTPYHLAWFYSVKIRHAYLFDQVDCYRDLIPKADIIESTIPTHAKTPSTVFYVLLMHLALLEKVSDQTHHWQAVQQLEEKLDRWQQDCPENILHKTLLVQAEKARLQGQVAVAIDCYDQSIAQAYGQGYNYESALANELAAKFYLDWGKEKVAASYMQDAYYGYFRWGATAKLADLENRYPQLLRPVLQQVASPTEALNTLITIASSTSSAHNSKQHSTSNSSLNQALDLTTVLKASQILSGTIELEALLRQLTQMILQNSGADLCALFLATQQGFWQLRAEATAETTTLCSISLENVTNLPNRLIHYVKNTRKTLILNDLDTELPVVDAYVNQPRPSSMLCLPLLNQDKLLGIVYLSNQSASGIFNQDRVAVLTLLCSQAAISLENARLFAESLEAEAALHASQKKIQKMANSLPGLIYQFRVDADDRASFTYVSERSTELLGFESHVLQESAEHWIQCIHPEDLTTFQQTINESMENLTPFLWIGRLNLPSGQQRWLEARSMPSCQADGSCLWDGVMLDVSDRIEAEFSFKASQSRLSFLVEQTPIGIIEWDHNFTVVGWNPAAESIFDYSETEMLGQHAVQIVPESDRVNVATVMTDLMKGCGGFYSLNQNIRKDGTVISCEWINTPLRDKSGQAIGIISMVQDVTERRRSQEIIVQKSHALEKAMAQLQNTQLQMVQNEKMATLGNLVAGVAHEVNNPIGFLNGSINNTKNYIQDLFEHLDTYQKHQPPIAPVQENADDIDLEFVLEDLPKLLDSMKGAINRIKGISTSLRTFSRADTENKVRVNLHEGIDSTLLILKYRLKANEQRPAIEVNKDYGELPAVNCFPGQLNQVFMNILANAIDALDEASQSRSFADIKAKPHCITIRTELDNNQVRITIADNGPGIPETVRDKIFDHLFTTKSIGKGTGLGLAIAHQIVVIAHGGRLNVQSEVGQGSRFCICLPLD
ncbi:MAG: AAA family ATPase [Cyanobacteria bacterium P01_D01_bin.56]